MTGWRTTLADRLTAAAERHDVPGASIAVGHGGDLIEAATGVLSRETGAVVTPDSLFHIGSATKPWTAALVLQLADRADIRSVTWMARDPANSMVAAEARVVPVNHGLAEEVASVVLFLVSDAAKFVNGALIDINGGRFLR